MLYTKAKDGIDGGSPEDIECRRWLKEGKSGNGIWHNVLTAAAKSRA